jgi:micrococcal nuclease
MKWSSTFKALLPLSIVLAFCLPTTVQAQERATATVLRVIDGDTLKVSYGDQEENIRLIGIDTPESSANPKAKRDSKRTDKDLSLIISQGKEATNYVKGLIKPGDTIQVELDVQTRDKYGRLLGYVYLSDGKMLNEEVVRAGYANLMTYPPNVKYQEQFLRAYEEARESKRGLWK